MSDYYFKNNEFVIENYDKQKTFASFLPGMAGKKGIPLWCHYCNRAQAITSFGLRDKNGCILEFYPANTAFRLVDKMGFRSFLKIEGKVIEAFSGISNAKRTMYISQSYVRLEEENQELGYKIEVKYYIVPEQAFAGLCRSVTITNTKEAKPFEILDGITQILPPNSSEWMLKHQSNLLKSWNNAERLKNNFVIYTLNSIPADQAEVNISTSANYYCSIVETKESSTVAPPIFDASLIFGYDTSLSNPVALMMEPLEKIMEKENIAADKVSVGFTPVTKTLQKMETIKIHTLIGNVSHTSQIEDIKKVILQDHFFDQSFVLAQKEITDMTSDVETKTAYPLFDHYMEQNYLDNILRGGYPYQIKNKNKNFIYHLFSRRHGDMEREYNFFSIAPEYYSQGNGNFRDVCQNRRSDCMFHPEVENFNVYQFASLFQLDGYNPLGVLGCTFEIKDKTKIKDICKKIIEDYPEKLEKALQKEFTPGSIINTIAYESLKTHLTDEEIFSIVFEQATQHIKADFGEGYWSDHFTYLMDLIENSLMAHPEKKNEYLFKDYSYHFFDSIVKVLPRSEKYCLTKQNTIRQYGSLLEKDEEKIERCHIKESDTAWAKDDEGKTISTNLFGKLLILTVNKFAILDSQQIGIEMEGNKPGWNDAMNGLPGLFASGVSETIETARLVKFLSESRENEKTLLPKAFLVLMKELQETYKNSIDEFTRWDQAHTAIEKYRDAIYFSAGEMQEVSTVEVFPMIDLMKQTFDEGLKKAYEIGKGIYPTFLTYEVTSYEKTNHIGHYGLETVKVKAFERDMLPYFLEAPARSMKYIEDKEQLKKQYEKIKQSDIYDHKLQMYKTSEPLEQCSFEIGRIRAFQKGWLERESNFLHMNYKYLLGLLTAGLYQEFYEEIKTNFVCFMDPATYGRSTLENSSFIATSNNPDPYVWGQGFVSRLSGSTAEMLNMWNLMMFGKTPILYEKNELVLHLQPLLSKDFFDENNTVTATLFGHCKVCYHNPKKLDAFEENVRKIVINGVTYSKVTGKLVEEIRNGEISQIDCYLE